MVISDVVMASSSGPLIAVGGLIGVGGSGWDMAISPGPLIGVGEGALAQISRCKASPQYEHLTRCMLDLEQSFLSRRPLCLPDCPASIANSEGTAAGRLTRSCSARRTRECLRPPCAPMAVRAPSAARRPWCVFRTPCRCRWSSPLTNCRSSPQGLACWMPKHHLHMGGWVQDVGCRSNSCGRVDMLHRESHSTGMAARLKLVNACISCTRAASRIPCVPVVFCHSLRLAFPPTSSRFKARGQPKMTNSWRSSCERMICSLRSPHPMRPSPGVL